MKRGSAASSSRGEPSYGTIDAVYVGNLQWWTTDAQIEELCSQFGSVQKFRFFEDKANGKSKGYVLVTFDSPKAAYTCKEGLDGCAPLTLSMRMQMQNLSSTSPFVKTFLFDTLSTLFLTGPWWTERSAL